MPTTRERAVIALGKIFAGAVKPKDILDELSHDLDKRERAFLMELVYGVLRHRDYLDWQLKGFLRKPSALSPDTLNNLRVAVYQLQYLRVPEWAAVNEAVEGEKGHRGNPPLVNGVLRNFLRQRDNIALPPEKDPVAYISITTSHPRWLVKRWIQRFGYDEAFRFARKNNEVPPLTIRIDGTGARAQALHRLAEKGVHARPTDHSPAGIIIEEANAVGVLSEAADFPYVVQDEAAQLVTYLLAPLPQERVLDACAAPGGKTTHIARLMGDSGEVLAVEADAERIGQIEENVARLGLHSVRIIREDAKNLEYTEYCRSAAHRCVFDRILLDAPCSALGVIRRNPDVRYRHSRKELLRFKEHQGALLRAVARLLKPEGVMVYSVCSTEPEEGEEVIKEFLQEHQDFSIIKGEFDFLEPFAVADVGLLFYRTFPHRHDMDGFFAARLKRARSEDT